MFERDLERSADVLARGVLRQPRDEERLARGRDALDGRRLARPREADGARADDDRVRFVRKDDLGGVARVPELGVREEVFRLGEDTSCAGGVSKRQYDMTQRFDSREGFTEEESAFGNVVNDSSGTSRG
jgi:hypothetical protein